MDKNKIINYCNKVIEISIYGLVFFIPISTSFIESFISLMLIAWIISKIIKKIKFSNLLYPTYLSVPILLYILAIMASTFTSSNFNISFKHLVFKTLEYFLLFFVIVEVVDKRILKNILITLILTAGILGIDGIFQYFTKWDFLRYRTTMMPTRINASFNAPNDFATYTVSMLPLVMSVSFLKFNRRWIRVLTTIIAFMLFSCLILSATRSVWLAVLLVIPLALLLGYKRFSIFILLLIILSFISFPLLSNLSKDRIVNFFNISQPVTNMHRRFLWEIGLNMFKDRPLLGQGLGTFMYNFTKFQPKNYHPSWGICYAHNCFLQIAAETGIMGFLTFILIVTILFFVTYKKIRKIKDNQFYYNILSGLLIGIFAYLVNSFFDTNLYSLQLSVLFWFMVALTVAVSKIIEIDESQSKSQSS